MGKKHQPTKRKRRAYTPKDEEYRLWIVAGVKLPGHSQKGLAGALGVSEPTVSKILKGTRLVQLGEVDKIADYFGPGHPPPNGEHKPTRSGVVLDEVALHPNAGLRVEAIIAPGYWGRTGVAMTIVPQVPIAGRLEPKFSGLPQYLCQLQADPNVYYVCAPFAALRAAPLNGEKVHVRRTRDNGECEDTIRIVKAAGGLVSLALEDAADDDQEANLPYPSRRAGESIEIRGLVLGRFVAEPV